MNTLENVLERARTIHGQKPGDTQKLSAFHAPEVECIGKGKARTRYEFGVKASLATTNERCKGGQFVLGALSLPGNPYDGHTLGNQLDRVARVTGRKPARAYVDRGYRGYDRYDRPDLGYEPRREPPQQRGNGTHHPVSRVRYRGAEDADERVEHRRRARGNDADRWEYDI